MHVANFILVSGEPSEDDSLPDEMQGEEESLLGKQEYIQKRSTGDRSNGDKLHYDYSKDDLGTGDKAVEKLSKRREDEFETAVKKPALPFYCSIPLVSRSK